MRGRVRCPFIAFFRRVFTLPIARSASRPLTSPQPQSAVRVSYPTTHVSIACKLDFAVESRVVFKVFPCGLWSAGSTDTLTNMALTRGQVLVGRNSSWLCKYLQAKVFPGPQPAPRGGESRCWPALYLGRRILCRGFHCYSLYCAVCGCAMCGSRYVCRNDNCVKRVRHHISGPRSPPVLPFRHIQQSWVSGRTYGTTLGYSNYRATIGLFAVDMRFSAVT